MKTKPERFMTIVTAALVLGLFVIFIAGLASRSVTPDFLGKSNFVWAITLLAGFSTFTLILLVRLSSRMARTIPRVALLGLISIGLFEGIGYLFPNVLPVQLLLRTPPWLRESLPESAFQRDNFRLVKEDSKVDDPDLVYRYAPNLDIQINQGEIKFQKITDQHGFANRDASLYRNADIVAIGDSFTMGETVEFDESWPQQLAQNHNLRVLNLGTSGWDVYQYPKVLEKYAPDVNLSHIIATLINTDLGQRFYRLTDEVSGPVLVDHHRWSTAGLAPKKNNYLYVIGDSIRSLFPFSTTAAFYLAEERPETCEFTLGGNRLSFNFSSIDLFVGSHVSTYLKDVRDDIDRIKQFAESQGTELHFVYLPSPERIYLPLLSSATDLNDCAEATLTDYQSGKLDLNKFYSLYNVGIYYSDDLTAFLSRDSEIEGIAANSAEGSNLFVDATPYLQSFASRGEKLSWTSDPHPNALGHKRIADFIAALVQD